MEVRKTEQLMLKHFETQIKFLENSAKTYDSGFEEEAINLSTHIRVLLHDTNTSTSLLKHLNIKDTMFFISSTYMRFPTNLSPYTGLFAMNSKGKYIPYCHSENRIPNKWFSFADWWNEIIIDDKHFLFSRKDIILTIANKDGGAHVDDAIEQKYANLQYNNSIGWKYYDGDNEYEFSNSAVYASIRQIAHEILFSIKTHGSIKSFTRKSISEYQARYINNRIYFLESKIISDPIGSKLLQDFRVTKTEKRIAYSDNLIYKDMHTRAERITII